MPQSKQTCPICNRPFPPFERSPRHVCPDCAGRVTSPDGRPLKFFNESLSGGYLAFYADDGTPYNSHECVIDGIRCYADEAHFDGIVIQVL